MDARHPAPTGKLRYGAAIMAISALFFAFDVASDIYERIIARAAPEMLDLLHLFFEVFSVGAMILAIRVLLQHLGRLQAENAQQGQSLQLLRGEMDQVMRRRFSEWQLSPAERDIAMYTLKGLSIAEIARARATAEGTVKAQTTGIFRKAGVASRTELMSLFMDEFLDLQTEQTG